MRQPLIARRSVIVGLAAAALVQPADAAVDGESRRGGIMTVRGWLEPKDFGLALVHEHALANFQGYADWREHPIVYDRAGVCEAIAPRLEHLKTFRVTSFVDATATHLGRDPVLLRMLSRKANLNIVTVTGNYAAFDYRFLPDDIAGLTVDALARRWIDEWQDGIDGSGVRPGMIKLGFNGGPLSPVEQKLIRAAAIAHRATGLTIGAHTGPAPAAFDQLAILREEKVSPSAWIWIHAQNEPEIANHIRAARAGAWIEFDGIDEKSLDQHVKLVTAMRDAGLLGRVLVSQDAGWYDLQKPDASFARSYETLFTGFLPALRKAGFSLSEIDMLLRQNPLRRLVLDQSLSDGGSPPPRVTRQEVADDPLPAAIRN